MTSVMMRARASGGDAHPPRSSQFAPNASLLATERPERPLSIKGMYHVNNNNNNTIAKDDDDNNNNRTRKPRKRRKKKSASVVPTNNPAACTPGKFAARDLYVSLRCQFKGRQQRVLTRVLMVNWEGSVVFDKPARDLKTIKEKVAQFIKGKVVIGHGLEYGLFALGLQHSWTDIRDCAHYSPFMQETHDALGNFMYAPRALEDLSEAYFDRSIRDLNDPVVAQARVQMDLYRHARVAWENEMTVLMRQEVAQHETNMLEHRLPQHLDIIEETATCGGSSVGELDAVSLTERFNKSLELSANEGGSVQAPTDTTIESDSHISHNISDDTSSLVSEQSSIWKPQEDGEATTPIQKVSPAWGLWLTRPSESAAGSSHPRDADHWLAQDDQLSPRRRERESEEFQEKQLLPHHLLDESFDDAERVMRPQEVSDHPIDGSDWLEPAPKRETGWFSRYRKTFEWRKDDPAVVVASIEARPEHGEQYDPTLSEGFDSPLRTSTTKSSWFLRLKRPVVEHSGASISDPPRASGDAWLSRSTHSSDDDWPTEAPRSSSRFSFFRRKSVNADDDSLSDGRPRSPCPVNVQG